MKTNHEIKLSKTRIAMLKKWLVNRNIRKCPFYPYDSERTCKATCYAIFLKLNRNRGGGYWCPCIQYGLKPVRRIVRKVLRYNEKGIAD